MGHLPRVLCGLVAGVLLLVTLLVLYVCGVLSPPARGCRVGAWSDEPSGPSGPSGPDDPASEARGRLAVPVAPPNATGYEVEWSSGFRVLVSRGAGERADVLVRLRVQLAGVASALSARPSVLAWLRGVPLWLVANHPALSVAAYHPDERWLTEQGADARWARGVTFMLARESELTGYFDGQPGLALHELAHAFLHQIWRNELPGLAAAFEAARQGGRYDALAPGRGVYALTHELEFFAELSAAYWGCSATAPVDRGELLALDPVAGRVIERAWRL